MEHGKSSPSRILNIVAAFRGMHVSPAKHSYAWLPKRCDFQTDAGQSDPYVPLFFAGDTKTLLWQFVEYFSLKHIGKLSYPEPADLVIVGQRSRQVDQTALLDDEEVVQGVVCVQIVNQGIPHNILE